VAYSAIGTLPRVVTTSARTAPIERNARDREAGGHRRMRVDDGARIGPLPVDLEVHLHLRGRIAIPLELLPFEIG